MRRTPPSEPSPSSPLMPASLASREAAPETAPPPPPPPPPRPRLRFRRRLDRLIVSAGKAPPPSAPRHVPHSRAIVPLKSPIWQCSLAVVESCESQILKPETKRTRMAQWGVHQDGGSFSGSKVVRPVALLKFTQSALLHFAISERGTWN